MSASAVDQTAAMLQARAGELLTLSFADPAARLYGQVRVTREADGGEELLALVLTPERTLAARHQRRTPGDGQPGALELEPPTHDGRRTVRFAGGQDGEGAFALEFRAVSGAGRLTRRPGDEPRGAASEQQLCQVSGSVRARGGRVAITGPGQVGVTPDAAASATAALRREVDGWLGADLALCARAVRPRRGLPHEQEWLAAVLFEGEPAAGHAVDDPRLSTTYDHDGRQLRAGLELWVAEDSDFPRRAAGETVAAGHLVLQQGGTGLRWDCAFLAWHMEGRRGVGPYSILRAT